MVKGGEVERGKGSFPFFFSREEKRVHISLVTDIRQDLWQAPSHAALINLCNKTERLYGLAHLPYGKREAQRGEATGL